MSSNPPDEDPEVTRIIRADAWTGADSTIRDRAYLVVLAGSNIGEMHRLDGNTVLGRGGSAKVRLRDDGVSRSHAKIMIIGDEVIIQDMDSANGTYINGERVEGCKLKDGDKIRLGSTTILKFTYHDRIEENFQQQLFDAAVRDSLTKAHNRAAFIDRLEKELSYSLRHKSPLCLLMLDIDHFKRVNDTHGHLAGDAVLVELADLVRRVIRMEDFFARYGGEEFAIICRGVTLESGGALAERLRALVEQTTFAYEGTTIPLTVSIGVGSFLDGGGRTPTDLISVADEALYEAKRNGRNRVMLHRPAS